MKPEQKKAVFYGVLGIITLLISIKNPRCIFLALLLFCITALYIVLHKKHCKEERFIYDNPATKKVKEIVTQKVNQKVKDKEEKKAKKFKYASNYEEMLAKVEEDLGWDDEDEDEYEK